MGRRPLPPGSGMSKSRAARLLAATSRTPAVIPVPTRRSNRRPAPGCGTRPTAPPQAVVIVLHCAAAVPRQRGRPMDIRDRRIVARTSCEPARTVCCCGSATFVMGMDTQRRQSVAVHGHAACLHAAHSGDGPTPPMAADLPEKRSPRNRDHPHSQRCGRARTSPKVPRKIVVRSETVHEGRLPGWRRGSRALRPREKETAGMSKSRDGGPGVGG